MFGTHETATSSSACAPTELDVSAPERHPTIRPPYRRPDILLPRRGRKTDFSIPSPFRETQAGVDYTALRDLLKAGEWEEADNEHRRLMCVLAGEDAEDRGWVYFTEVKQFPVKDLKTIDNLWTFYSDGKFGFSVQRKIWIGKKRQWAKFFKEIDWVQGENNAYRKWPEEFIWKKEAKKGHMPLTNALRGTQLLNALLEHPAFAPRPSPRTRRTRQPKPWSRWAITSRRLWAAACPVSRASRSPLG